ncbi:hypothetical protein PIB30_092062 [Stylosanthes scabra]|uniref:Uncharacterized protein n=1 Tax=Stylosanthes scabra TaxID=79078 RepID=A0ABU6YSD3_9FABA|nr:hypothetical protein [Stylosanthes scabra]
MEPSRIQFGSLLPEHAKLFTDEQCNSKSSLDDCKLASPIFCTPLQEGEEASMPKADMEPSKAPEAIEAPAIATLSSTNIIEGSDEEAVPGHLTAPPTLGRRLFNLATPPCRASTLSKRSRGTSAPKTYRRIPKPRFKPTYDMDLNRADTVLFTFLFSEGHAMT